MHFPGAAARAATLALATALLGVLPAAALEVTQIATVGLAESYGIDYVPGARYAYFVESSLPEDGGGRLHRIDMTTMATSVLGTGYTVPRGLVLAADGRTAYVSSDELGGCVLRVDLRRPNRSDATVVASSFDAASTAFMGQLALDEARGHAYVTKPGAPGAGLWRVDLLTGAKVLVIPTTELVGGYGLVVDRDARFAYIADQPMVDLSTVKRLNLATGTTETLATSAVPLWGMSWSDPAQATIDVVAADQDDSATASVVSLEVGAASIQLREAVPRGAFAPHQISFGDIARVSDDRMLVTAGADGVFDVRLSDFDLGPDNILLGIGLVPVDRIGENGFADTTADPAPAIRVKDAPFGGTLAVMMNHAAAYGRTPSARWYQVLVDGVPQEQPWSDYRWDANQRRFVNETIVPTPGGFFPVRNPRDLWYTPLLACRLGTLGLTNERHVLAIRLCTTNNPSQAAGRPDDGSVFVTIDNAWPTARINAIRHEGDMLPACSIVHGACTDDHFTFCIDAYDPDQHLGAWSLRALWGNNQSEVIGAEQYVPADPPAWYGRACGMAPDLPWEAYNGELNSARCAYAFVLSVSDRAIDGYRYIHNTVFHKTLTIDLSGCP